MSVRRAGLAHKCGVVGRLRLRVRHCLMLWPELLELLRRRVRAVRCRLVLGRVPGALSSATGAILARRARDIIPLVPLVD